MASVLIIDGPGEGRNQMTAALPEAGHHVLVANDGPEGVMTFARRRVDVVICELLLPQIDGLEVIGRLRRNAPDLPIVATTGGNSACRPEQLLAVARANGVNATLQKPFSDVELVAAVSEALSGGVDTPFLKVEAGVLASPLMPSLRPSRHGGTRAPRTIPSK